ncbi:ATP-binding protein [Kibdelosporangium phytohabitans]|uniref:HTH cro/C1-type domain-containing protein n=1 Tax=Kibdelosporangium phytohabitans TaxID=860235 RepID=A0A0N9IAB2_9PSEU|nr:helix-turn-helix domain-containing protein [Kibdelosporangium phytohabitans]ALG13317.1 hypothetical protein AOZ06_46435 [Kibdelosporangium phytohabitans]MBE1465100.1 tetratricopeptide (TPR) repeat protein [Kibdelosporangium phytohabitans]
MAHRSGSDGADFGGLLREARETQRISLRELARRLHYSHGYLSKVERGIRRPTAELAQQCDTELGMRGALVAASLSSADNIDVARLRPAQLPIGPRGFVGRDQEMARLDELISYDEQSGGARVAAIDGLPGVGKTTLALRWAHEAQAEFPGGVLFADLHGYGQTNQAADPGDVLEHFLRSLGVPAEQIPRELGMRASLFRTVLQRERVLIVLDNAANYAQVQPILPSSPGSVVVVTSRQRLSGLVIEAGAMSVTLAPLEADEAVSLIKSSIGRRRATENHDVLARIASSCGYLPLALKLAAERIAWRPGYEVAELEQELAAEEDRLDLLAAEDEPRAVRAVFSWSYQALTEPVARAYRLLGLYPDDEINVPGVAVLAGVTRRQARFVIDALASMHFVQHVAADRYRLHDLLRVYAAELVAEVESEQDRHAAVARLVHRYLGSLVSASRAMGAYRVQPVGADEVADVEIEQFGDYDSALAWLESQRQTIAKIVELAVKHGFHDEAWQIVVLLWDYLQVRKPWGVWVRTHDLGLRAARAARNEFGEAWVLNNFADLYRRWGELDRAEHDYYRPALATRRRIGDRRGMGWTLLGLGFVALERKDFESAADHFRAQLVVHREVGDKDGEACGLACEGTALLGLGRLAEAEDRLLRAVVKHRDLGDRHAEAWTLTQLARVRVGMGDRDVGLRYFDQASGLHTEMGDVRSAAEVYEEKGGVLHRIGRVTDARDCWEKAVALFDRVDEAQGTAARARINAFTTGHADEPQ